MTQQHPHMPWLDMRLSEVAMNYLRNVIDNPVVSKTDNSSPLAGNISKSVFIQDKDNWFYENVLREMSEFLYLKEWNNHYDIVVTKSKPSPKFTLDELWVNYQKQYEFNPPHFHAGMFSFVVFLKIPTHWKEQHALPWSANSNMPLASDFSFLLGREQGRVQEISIPLSPEDEGRMLFFPAWLTHQVFPFYGTEEERITMSGNIVFQEGNNYNCINVETKR